MRRGSTLIELMIVVAIIGITCAAAGVSAERARDRGQAELQRAQALLLLEYEAEVLSTAAEPDAGVRDRLLAPLPDGALTRSSAGDVVTLELTWRDPFGRPVSRSLSVFTRGSP